VLTRPNSAAGLGDPLSMAHNFSEPGLFPEPPKAAAAPAAPGAPLAARMRPVSLDEFIGQEAVVGPGSPLRALIETDRLSSVILWGPPGSGKTSLAAIIAGATHADYLELSAVSAGVADVRKAIAAGEAGRSAGRRTILFIDEIHRFNKAQQDALLKAVESGVVTLIGATTENPFFEVNSPLLSRSLLFRLEALSQEQVLDLMRRALADAERGLGATGVKVDPEALTHIADRAGGDARFALNALEVCVAAAQAEGRASVTAADAEASLQRRLLRYDKGGDQHYDVISAFIKSMRGSDADAAVYWLARMIDSGEDPEFIARRMVIFASEDVGNADPEALVVAVAAFNALQQVGLPEAGLNLAQAVTYLATAEKSNASAVALWSAQADVERLGSAPVPTHLRDASYRGARRIGHGKGYKYPHEFPEAYVDQQYLPEALKDAKYYKPSDRGQEAEIRRRQERRHRG